ncbi:MAG: Gfo/Idh/MocA family protein [Planctomycetia bacterium]
MSSEIRAGIIGLGFIGRLHLRAASLVPGVRVVAVAEPHAAAREAAPAGVERFADYRDLLARDLDFVTICLPTVLHHPVALAALEAGKHVLIEKPVTTTYAQAEDLMAAARARGRVLYTGMTHRFYPEVRAVKERLDQGEFGEVVMLRDCILESLGFLGGPAWYRDPAAAGGGTVLSSGIHLVDRVLWFAGRRPRAVAGCTSNALLGGPLEDAAQMTLDFGPACSAQLTFGWLAEPHPLVCDLEIIGTRGSAVIHTWQGYELRTAAGTSTHAVHGDQPHADKVVEGLRGEIGEFSTALREGRPPWPPVEESSLALEVVEAFYRAARSRTGVALGLEGHHTEAKGA